MHLLQALCELDIRTLNPHSVPQPPKLEAPISYILKPGTPHPKPLRP